MKPAHFSPALLAAGNVTKRTNGTRAYSHLGFRDKKDLGDGLASIFRLEMGTRISGGNLDNATGQVFDRQIYIGLESRDWRTGEPCT